MERYDSMEEVGQGIGAGRIYKQKMPDGRYLLIAKLDDLEPDVIEFKVSTLMPDSFEKLYVTEPLGEPREVN